MNKYFFALLWLLPSAACAQQGSWESITFNFGNDPAGSDRINAIHLIHIYDGIPTAESQTGRFLAYTFEPVNLPCRSPRNRLWTPPAMNQPVSPGTFDTVELCRTDVFCAGHSALADGRIFHAGGDFDVNGNTQPTDHADIFTPSLPIGTQWNNPATPPNMTVGRFYPTCTTLGDGRVLVTSGSIDLVNHFPPLIAMTPEL